MNIKQYQEHRERLKNDPQYALEWKQKQEKELVVEKVNYMNVSF